MITIPTLGATCPDLANYEKMARILAQELPNLSLLSEPLDVVDSLANLSTEMSRMPEVIEDCRLATEAFNELDQAIGRMFALADRAVEIPEKNDEERNILNEEFKNYAHIVARLAGDESCTAPALTLSSQAEALAARQILAYLNDARHKFTRRLDSQRRQINHVMDEALTLLVRLVDETCDLSHNNRESLFDILDRLGTMSELTNFTSGYHRPQTWLH